MATITITDGVNVGKTKIKREDKSNMDTLEFQVSPSYTATIGDTIEYYNASSTLIFKGIVQNISNAGEKRILAYDFGSQLMNRNVNEIYNNLSPEAIIESIVDNYSDLTYVSTITSGITITKFVVKDKRAWDVINELTEQLNANFRVDKNLNFFLQIRGEDTSTKSISNANAKRIGAWREDSSQMVNTIILIGDQQIFNTIRLFSGTGGQTDFTLAEVPIDVKVEVDSGSGFVEKAGFVEGATTGDYQVDRENKKIIFSVAPPSGTDNIRITYTYPVQVKVEMPNSVSIGLYGKREKRFVKPYINTFADARKFAKNFLDIWAFPLRSSKWQLNNPKEWDDYIPNEKITVNDAQLGINGDFIIKKVERENIGKVIITIGEEEDDLLNWQKEAQFRIKQLEERDNNATILQLYDNVSNLMNIELTPTITRYQYRDKGTCFYLGDDDNGLLREAATPYNVILCEEGTGDIWHDIT